MADSDNQELRIHIVSDADNKGFQQTSDSAKQLTVASGELTNASKLSAEASEADTISKRELRKVLDEIGRQVAPGAAGALSELALGPVGAGIALIGVYELLKEKIDAASEAAQRFSEIAAEPETGGVKALETAWDDATKAQAAYEAALATAGQDQDPIATQVKNFKEIARAQGSPTADADALALERRLRLAQGGVLAQTEMTANAAKQAADAKYDTDEGKLNYAKKVLTEKDSKEYKDLQSRQEAAAQAVDSANSIPDFQAIPGSNGGIQDNRAAKAAALSKARGEQDALNKEIENYRQQQDQLESTEKDRLKAKDEADEAAKKAAGASLHNQTRLGAVSGELQQAQLVEAAKAQHEAITEKLATPLKGMHETLGEALKQTGFTIAQTTNIAQGLLNNQIQMQAVLDAILSRLKLHEGRFGQMDHSGR
jgi:hypothetical protein